MTLREQRARWDHIRDAVERGVSKSLLAKMYRVHQTRIGQILRSPCPTKAPDATKPLDRRKLYGWLRFLRLVKGVGEGAHGVFRCKCGEEAVLRLVSVRCGNNKTCGTPRCAEAMKAGRTKPYVQ